MARKQLVKHFSLAFLGEGWEEGFIDFQPLSISDVNNSIAGNVDAKNPDPKEVKAGLQTIINILTNKFIRGKFPNEDGTLDDITKEEVKDLPNEIVQAAMTFLSQTENQNSVQPSDSSSPQKTE